MKELHLMFILDLKGCYVGIQPVKTLMQIPDRTGTVAFGKMKGCIIICHGIKKKRNLSVCTVQEIQQVSELQNENKEKSNGL
jgi:hypothetical protein